MKELTLRELNRLDNKPLFSVKDPISALTHFIGFVGAILVTPLLLSRAAIDQKDTIDLIGLCVYSLSMIILYGASTSYHTFLLPAKPARLLKKFDHMSIFLLIAGTYTPICLNLNPDIGIQMLIAVWTVGILGIIMKAFWVYCPKYVSSIVYISMGWIAIFKIREIFYSIGKTGFFWLITGGIFYTIGGIIYARKWSLSKDWGNHEIFHLFVLLGSICHFILIFAFIA